MQALRAASAVRRAAVSAASAAPAPARAYSRRPQNLAETTYHLLFKRNFTYYTFVVAGAIILESVYGWVGDSLWASLNEGVREAHVKLRTYETVDWSKFESPLDDLDEEEEEEEEEEDDE